MRDGERGSLEVNFKSTLMTQQVRQERGKNERCSDGIQSSDSNLINICVDRSVQGEIGGRIYHYYQREPWKIENVVQLLRYMEEFYDGIRFPEAAVMLRNFSETEKEGREKTWADPFD